MKVKYIENNFKNEILHNEGLSVVDFWAPWCGPCKMFGPIFEKVSEKYQNIKFCKFNVDEDINNVSRNLGIMSIPTIIVFKNGKEIKRNIGFMNENELNNFLEEL